MIPVLHGDAIVFALVDDEDYPIVSRFAWSLNGRYAYASFSTGKRTHAIQMHRLISGHLGDGLVVDHMDGNGLNNQKANLRPCTQGENMRNRKKHKHGKSQYKGVWRDGWKRKWRARIRIDGRHIHLGYHDTEEEAAKAYDVGAQKYHGEFAKLNFPCERSTL